jgi:hypothetical protein
MSAETEQRFEMAWAGEYKTNHPMGTIRGK